MYPIQRLEADWGAKCMPQLVELTQDAEGVDGFLAPICDPNARQYWTKVFSEVGHQCRTGLPAVHG